MGLRKTGSSREYNSIDVRFSTTVKEMALAMRHQCLREQSATTEGDDEVKALTHSLAGGMKINVEETPMSGTGLATHSVWTTSLTNLALSNFASSLPMAFLFYIA